MRAFLRSSVCAASLVVASTTLAAFGPVALTGAAAWAQDKGDEPVGKQIPLTQKIIDNLIAVQKQIRAIETAPAAGKAPPDPKVVEAKMNGIAKSNGFASTSDFADASYSVGLVLSGMDDNGNYIGTQANLKKQMDEVKADTKMPPKEKKEALDELEGAMKSANAEKPLPGNIDLVKANATKLSETMQGD